MAQLSTYAKMRILVLYSDGNTAPKIVQILKEENIRISRVSVWRFLVRYKKTGTIARKEGSGRPTKMTSEVMALVEEQMCKDDETTAFQIHKILNERGIHMSIRTIFLLSENFRMDLPWQCVLPIDKRS